MLLVDRLAAVLQGFRTGGPNKVRGVCLLFAVSRCLKDCPDAITKTRIHARFFVDVRTEGGRTVVHRVGTALVYIL